MSKTINTKVAVVNLESGESIPFENRHICSIDDYGMVFENDEQKTHERNICVKEFFNDLAEDIISFGEYCRLGKIKSISFESRETYEKENLQ